MNEKDALAHAYSLFQQGNFAAAYAHLQPWAKSVTAHPTLLHLAGAAAAATGMHPDAVRWLRRASAATPDDLAISYKLARVLVDAGQPQEALALYLQLIADGVKHADVYTAAAVLLHESGRNEEALQTLQHALQLAPDAANNWYLQSVLQARLRRLPDTIDSLQHAIALAPDQIHFHRDLALALYALHRNAEALPVIERARDMQPASAVLWTAHAAILSRLGRYDDAIASSEHALKLDPEHADAKVNLALTLLTLGQMERAWPLYEARWQGALADPARHQSIPRWSGKEQVRDKCILLWAEQGFGDTIQFSRYALAVAAVAGEVVLEVPAELAQLMTTLTGGTGVGEGGSILIVERGETLPPVDYQLPLMSTSLILNTRLDNIPAQTAYLQADPIKQAHWQAALGARQRPRIGIVCAGNGGNQRDATRSLPLAACAPLFEQVDADFYLLQPALRQSDYAYLQQAKVPALHWPGRELQAFDDTSALIAELDLVISVDTAVAHLAGAMGVPVWILLSELVDWRWFLQRSDSPWYPSARLWRQHQSGDWDEVIAGVKAALLKAVTPGSAS